MSTSAVLDSGSTTDPGGGPRSAAPRRTRYPAIRPYVLALAGFVVAALFALPYLVMLLDALRPSGDVLATPPTLFPRTWQWDTFGTILSDERFLNWLKSSLIVAATSTVLVLVIAVPAAYFTARHQFRGRTVFLLIVLMTQMFSPTALVVGLYREFFELNLVNTYLSLILTNTAFNLAFAIWILQGFFSSIPREIEEAAQLDGCSRIATLRRVMLPLTLPGLVTTVTFTFIAAWNEYVVALTLIQDDARKPLTVGISSYVTGYQQSWDQLFAASLVAIVPVVILFAAIEKHLVGGLIAGAVK